MCLSKSHWAPYYLGVFYGIRRTAKSNTVMPRITTPLTDTAIRKAKPGLKPIKLSDGQGMYLLITPANVRKWQFDYTRPGSKSRNTISFGVYPDKTLAEARQDRADARNQIANGIDPSENRKAVRAFQDECAANSFQVVANEWLTKQDWVPDYQKKILAWMANDVFPFIGKAPVSSLTAQDFLKVARRIEERGAFESAHRIMQNCSQVMRYATATGRANGNPVEHLKGALAPAPEKHHAAITDPEELGGVLRAMYAYQGSAVTRAALRLAPMLFVRPGELRKAEWAEIDFDRAEWCIPAEKMKMKQALIVPLSSHALEVFKELKPLTGHGKYVFPGGRDKDRPMSENAVTAALRSMGFDKDKVTGHGFRATARTLLDEELGWRPDFIEHQLAHAVKDPNGRAYNRTSHLAERKKMMQDWSNYLYTLMRAC